MPSVSELTALYGNLMLGPRHGPGVCEICFNLTAGYDRCWACAHGQQWLDAVDPISYSVAGEQLHHVLASYKRLTGRLSMRFTVELAAVLWRHLVTHEQCVARASGITRFDLVTTVPSGDRERDARHPLRCVAGELVAPTRDRFARLLMRSETPVIPREFDRNRYEPTRPLSGQAVLLIDDTWTTGASAQSAAVALKSAGAGAVAAVVIGRHLNREWHHNDARIQRLPQPFEWGQCVVCGPARSATSNAAA